MKIKNISLELWHKVTLGLILGIVCGVFIPEYSKFFKPLGTIFLKMIKMIITPLIFCALVNGVTSLEDHEALGRMGGKAVLSFVTTTFFAVVFGLLVGYIIEPGKGVIISFDSSAEFQHKKFDIVEFILNIVPENAIYAFSSGNILQVVFFAMFTAFTINKMGSSANTIKYSIQMISKIVFKMISLIIQFSPYAAFSLTAWVISTQGIDIMLSLSKLLFAVVIAMICQYLIFGVLILVFAKISPIPFYRKSIKYQSLAFSTSSSKATLPVTMDVCRNALGISETSTSFILPLGASINMDGFAINLGLTAVFFAQLSGISLSSYDYLVIILTSTLGSIGGAGIPGASLIMLPMVLASVNLPIDGVAILSGIDRILDMLRSTINITGDATITLIIDKSEGGLDEEKYFS